MIVPSRALHAVLAARPTTLVQESVVMRNRRHAFVDGRRAFQASLLAAGVVTTGVLLPSASARRNAIDVLPAIVTPGMHNAAPSDAVVLFNGKNTDAWTYFDGSACQWIIDGDAMVVKPGSGSIISKEKFNDAQVHLEFATPTPAQGEGQERGNSGMYIQGRYEVQILDSFDNETYANGQCSSIYGQYEPLVNASRKPGEWQSYDVIFHAPKFDESGKKIAPGTITVLHNGVLTQDHVELKGVTGGNLSEESAQPGPLMLQDHGNTMRFRNIWFRPLK